MSFIVTAEWINEFASYHGPRGNSWKQAQLDILDAGSHRGWIERATGKEISDDDRETFEFYKDTPGKHKKKKKRMSQEEIDESHNSEPDWDGNCSSCDASPIVPETGMCGPCTFGEAETVGGNW